MTAAEKTDIACFLDLAAAVTGSGYYSGEREYHFADDPPASAAAAEAPALRPSDFSPLRHASASSAAAQGEPVSETENTDSLEQVAADVRSCTGCKLCAARTNAVPGEGAAGPSVMVIGEAPGADEDASGRPFVGKAGQLLDKMLAAISLSREDNCFIANVIKCRPPANRDPQPDETAACSSFLARQIKILKPRFILCAGRIAAHTLLNTTEPIGRLRGRFIDFDAGDAAIPFLATYHPSALLRNEDLKRPAWEDLKLLRSAMEETAP